MADVSVIDFGDGVQRNIKDATARTKFAGLHQPYKVSVFSGSSTGTTKYYKVIEKVIGDPAAMVNPVHLSGTIGTWGYAKKAIFDIEIDFRSAENSVISICGVISKKWTDYADIVATYDSSTTTIRIYVKLEAGWNFADFASNFETIASPTAESSTTGSVTKLMSASDVVNLDQKASTSAFGFAKVDGTTITSNDGVLSVVGGGGSSIKKTRYTITASSWSASANSDGYYTYTQTLSPAVKSSPNVYIAGSTDSTQPTASNMGNFERLILCKVNGSILTLYANTKPTGDIYIWVEGEEGTASGDVIGNIIRENNPAEASFSESEVFTGERWIDGKPIYRKVINIGTLPNTGDLILSNQFSADVVIKCYGFARKAQTGGDVFFPLPFSVPTSLEAGIGLYAVNNGEIAIKTGTDRSNCTGKVIVEYTKS